MEYDPNEMFREDPGEMELSPEFNAEMQLQEEAAQLENTQLDETSTPTGGQPEPAPQTEVATAPPETEEDPTTFKNPDGSINYESLDKAAAGLDKQDAELLLSIPTSLLDFGVETINMIPGVNIPKLTRFENEITQSVREISSVVTPTLMGGAALKAAGLTANARVGWSIGQNKFVQFMGERGVEALAGVAVGAVSSEYTEDNLTGTLKKSFPKTFDFIPDSMATLAEDDEDTKRAKNIYEDLGLGFVTDLAVGSARLVGAIGGAVSQFRKSNRLVGETPQARKWLDTNKPPASSADPEEAVIQSAIKQEEALDEMGMYGYSMNPAMDQPIKGVHDMYDYTEIGVRTVDDFGVVGASVDAVRVARNLDTVYGRLGNVISEPALKYSLTSGENAQDVVLGLADQLHQAGRIGMEGNGWKVTFDDVIDEGENLAIQLFDPRMSKEDIRKVLEPFITRTDDGKEILAEGGFAMAAKALRGFGSELTSMDVARAQSILAGSLSGRISDLSEGARLMEGTAAVEVAQEKIIDMMQYVTQLSASAKYYKNRKMNLIQQVKNGFKNIEGYNEATVLGAGETAKRIFEDSQKFGNTLRQIQFNQPRLMEEFLFAYELTDGSVDTIVKMNNWTYAQTADLGKAFINLNPEVENKLVAGVWSTIYNSILGPVSAVKAAVGNFGGIVSQPVSYFAGAALSGKGLKEMQRGWIAYSSINETMSKALPYAGDVFLRASREPNSVRSTTRLDLLLQSEKELDFLKMSARRQAAEGNPGLQYVVNQIELLNDLSKDPVLRFGPNAMTALDGFTGVFNASAEARFRAMDELASLNKPINKKTVKPIADKYYKQMFGENGLLNDDAVKYATDEMALNIDTPLAQGVTDLSNMLPGAKPFMMFQNTGMNVIDIMGKYGPWTPFQRDVNELAYVKLDDLLGNEARIDELLKARNINIETMDSIAKQNKIADLKYMTRGRKAIGALAMLGTYNLVMNDRITGDGFYDKETQMARVKNSNWQKRSIKGLDGKWYPYDQLGPIADWLALAVNVADNFDSLGEAQIENFGQKLAFIMSAAITDRTSLSSIKPLMDITSGNGAAINRWSAGFVNSLGPLAATRGDFSKILSEGLVETESDFMSQLGNRNRFMGAIFDNANQPYIYSPVSGKKANGYSFLQRLWNAYSPIQVHAEQSPEEKFLQEMEFDVNTNFRSKDGVKLTAPERSELFRLMGERGFFKEAIQEIMRDAGDWKSIEKLREMRNQGYKSDEVSLKKWHDLHARLSEARRAAEYFAFADMDADMYAALELRQIQKQLTEEANIVGETFDDSILNIRN